MPRRSQYGIVDSVRTPATFDVATETARHRLENDQWAPETLLPTEAFSDRLAIETAFRQLCTQETPCGRDA